MSGLIEVVLTCLFTALAGLIADELRHRRRREMKWRRGMLARMKREG